MAKSANVPSGSLFLTMMALLRLQKREKFI